MIDRLVRRGLVQRIENVDDRRSAYIRLTAKGAELERRALASYVEGADTLMAPLSAAERATLDGWLERLRICFEDPEAARTGRQPTSRRA